MIDDVLRIPKEKIMEPLAKALPGVSPTAITVTACLVGVASGAAAIGQQYGLALGLWGANRLLDGLDGTMARANGKQSDLGGYLDLVLDMVVYAAIPLGLALGSNLSGIILALAVLFASFYINSATWMVLSSFLEKRCQGAKARGELTTVTIPRGLVEGLETFLFYSLFFIFPQWLTGLFSLMAGLVVLTSIQRVVWAFHHLKS
mgnify:CR=1 FL=1